MIIYYQGTDGSFSSIAAKEYFKSNDTFVGCKTFTEVFANLKEHDYAVLPIENTIAGSIHENYDLLYKNNVYIVGETQLHIEHNLIGLPNSSVQTLTKVFSHYKALEQCQHFFDTNPQIEEVIYYDTAGAVEYIQNEGNLQYAAIASKQAAKLHGLHILKHNIEDNVHNLTRFIVVGYNNHSNNIYANKCSLLFSVHHSPHSLQRVLGTLANSNCNLTKIESRPLIGKPFEYLFFVDFEFNVKDRKSIEATLALLEKQQPYYKHLGYYTKA